MKYRQWRFICIYIVAMNTIDLLTKAHGPSPSLVLLLELLKPNSRKVTTNETLNFLLKSTVFLDKTLCTALKVSRRFRGTYRLNLQGGSAYHLLSRWFLSCFILRPWRLKRYVPPKRPLIFNGLHGVISQKTILFTTTAVRTSNALLDFSDVLLNVINVHTIETICFNALSWHRAILIIRHLVISTASPRTM
jgi:hypothetical protein